MFENSHTLGCTGQVSTRHSHRKHSKGTERRREGEKRRDKESSTELINSRQMSHFCDLASGVTFNITSFTSHLTLHGKYDKQLSVHLSYSSSSITNGLQ